MIKLNFTYLKKNFMKNNDIPFQHKILIIECVSALPDDDFVISNDIPLYRCYFGALFYTLEEKVKVFYMQQPPCPELIANVNKLLNMKIDSRYIEILK